MMTIHSLRIENFKGIEYLELGQLPDQGVIVISGDNEEGKSTIMDAFFLLCEYAHSSNAKQVRLAQPVGRDVAPSVTAHLTAGPVEFKVKKTWLRSRSAELEVYRPTRESLTGRQADDKLQDILNTHLDRELAAAVFLRQGFLQPTLQATELPSLVAALDSRSGEPGDSKTASHAELMAAAQKEYARYFTKSGGYTTEVKKLNIQCDTLGARHAEAAAQVKELERFVEQVGQAEREQARARAELPGAVELAEKRRAEKEAAEKTMALKKECERGVAQAESELERLTEQLEGRKRLVDDVERRQATRDALQQDHQAAAARAKTELTKVDELAAAVEDARDNEAKALEQWEQARNREKAAQARVTLAKLLKRERVIGERQKGVAKAREAIEQMQITSEDVQELERARQNFRVAQALAEASRAKLQVRGPVTTAVAIDGEPVVWEDLDAGDTSSSSERCGHAVVALHDGARILIGEVEATYIAGGREGEAAAAESDAEAAQAAFEQLLARLRCTDVDEARSKAARCAEARRDLDEARRLLAEALDGDTAEEIAAQREELAAVVAAYADSAADASEAQPPCTDSAQAELAEIHREVDQAERVREDAARARIEAEAQFQPWLQKTAANEAIRLKAQLDSATEELDSVRRQLEREEQARPKSEIATVRVQAEARVEELNERLRKIVHQLEETNPELVRELYLGAQEKVEALRRREEQARETILELKARVEMAQGAEERLARAAAELEVAERRRESVHRRARAAQVLFDTLRRHREKTRERYAAPFAEALNRLTAPVFGPRVQFRLDETLAIVARENAGEVIDVDALSGGAKEQLMILTRLAAAQLAGGSTEQLAVPVFVDDALGNTDTGRLERMGTVLSQLGATGQIFVFTCVPGRYDSVRGKHELPMKKLKS
ncbi:hypothetical protein CATYP_06645 [Corynebacterium atypicum]|uniref:Rad50/SbcC-type AAA domain-containing protein n=1 Tax=Corynebacterium atypicum TaxID=191610 RepID=A0ABM5QNG1_9CORY|nr:hypothetical protein [Corynebacterium atypicum]AIG64335.1 hypothetical protein CATYP_06645 [Corynebacterium atypicum]